LKSSNGIWPGGIVTLAKNRRFLRGSAATSGSPDH
jgi:hypothetical protein